MEENRGPLEEFDHLAECTATAALGYLGFRSNENENIAASNTLPLS